MLTGLMSLWPIVWHSAAGLSVFGICVAVFIFSATLAADVSGIPIIGPLIASNIKFIRDLAIIGAVASAVALAVYAKGIHDEANRWKAAEQTAIEQAKQARATAVRDVKRGGLRRDQYDRDN